MWGSPEGRVRWPASDSAHRPGIVRRDFEAGGLDVVELEVAVISEEELMDIRALQRQGYGYAEIGRLLGRDWRTVKRYLEHGAQPAYHRRRAPSMLDQFKPLIDQWLAGCGRRVKTRPPAPLEN